MTVISVEDEKLLYAVLIACRQDYAGRLTSTSYHDVLFLNPLHRIVWDLDRRLIEILVSIRTTTLLVG